jgi:hypothetical protein
VEKPAELPSTEKRAPDQVMEAEAQKDSWCEPNQKSPEKKEVV